MSINETDPIQEFLNYLSFQKRYSPNTIISYQNDLSEFSRFIIGQYNITNFTEISTVIIRSWLASLKENKISSRTINRKISSLKSFFKYLLKIKAIEASPVSVISCLKTHRSLPSFIAEKDVNTLLNHDFFPATFEGKTVYLLIEILYQTGIRRSELIHLKENDIDRSAGTIKVLGKGNKERLIPVNNNLIVLIDNYISEKKLLEEITSPFLLTTKKGKTLYPKYVYNMVKKYLSLVSTNERKSPHILRHSFATHLTNNGAQINAIKELLGHSSLAATQIYTHNSIEKLKEVYNQAHPKA
jgi:integrase/recombinase XerC